LPPGVSVRTPEPLDAGWWRHGWVDACINGWMHGWMQPRRMDDELTSGQRMDELLHRWMDGWTDRRVGLNTAFVLALKCWRQFRLRWTISLCSMSPPCTITDSTALRRPEKRSPFRRVSGESILSRSESPLLETLYSSKYCARPCERWMLICNWQTGPEGRNGCRDA